MTQRRLDPRPGMVLEHWGHVPADPCTRYCYHHLPRRPRTIQVHGHEEGESCDWSYCYYRPTLLGRVRNVLDNNPGVGGPLTRVLRRLLK